LSVTGTFSLPLKLVPSGSPPRRVTAAIIPLEAQDTLGRILAVLPPTLLGKVSVAFTERSIYLLGQDAAHAIPLGVMYEDLGDHVYVPLGWSLSPPIPSDVLRQLARAGRHAALCHGRRSGPSRPSPSRAFVAAARVLLADLPVVEESLIAPPLDDELPLPDLWPAPPGLLAQLFAPGARDPLPPQRNPQVLPDGTTPPSTRPTAPTTPSKAPAVAENSLDRFVSRFVLPLVTGGPVLRRHAPRARGGQRVAAPRAARRGRAHAAHEA
jgi:hypothetical protein